MTFGAIYGPLILNYLLCMAPFMTHEKVYTTKCKAIVDLSYPDQLSVNASASKYKYFGTYF